MSSNANIGVLTGGRAPETPASRIEAGTCFSAKYDEGAARVIKRHPAQLRRDCSISAAST
jgi:hypothetical protein